VKDKAVVGRTLLALREQVRIIARIMGLFEDPPEQWLLRRRDRLVKQRGLDVAKIESAIAARAQARTAKHFAESDRIRDELKKMGVEIMDTPKGTTWKVV
jgi:cysteinyl-tRNA synthetase